MPKANWGKTQPLMDKIELRNSDQRLTEKILFNLSEIQFLKVCAAADELGVSRSELIRQALREKIEEGTGAPVCRYCGGGVNSGTSLRVKVGVGEDFFFCSKRCMTRILGSLLRLAGMNVDWSDL